MNLVNQEIVNVEVEKDHSDNNLKIFVLMQEKED